MAEYIDREAVHRAINKAPTGYWGSEGHLVYADDAHKQIDAIPAADVVEARHASWIEDGYYGEPCVCSYCGEPCKDTVMGKPRWNYCPMCGAVMDGGQDEALAGPYDLLYEEGGPDA